MTYEVLELRIMMVWLIHFSKILLLKKFAVWYCVQFCQKIIQSLA